MRGLERPRRLRVLFSLSSVARHINTSAVSSVILFNMELSPKERNGGGGGRDN